MKAITSSSFVCLIISLTVGNVAARGRGKPVPYFDSPQQHFVTSRPQVLPYKTAKPVLPPTDSPSRLPTRRVDRLVIPSTVPSELQTGKSSGNLSNGPTKGSVISLPPIPLTVPGCPPTGMPNIYMSPKPSKQPSRTPTPFTLSTPSKASSKPFYPPTWISSDSPSLKPNKRPSPSPSRALPSIPSKVSSVPFHRPTEKPNTHTSTKPSKKPSGSPTRVSPSTPSQASSVPFHSPTWVSSEPNRKPSPYPTKATPSTPTKSSIVPIYTPIGIPMPKSSKKPSRSPTLAATPSVPSKASIVPFYVPPWGPSDSPRSPNSPSHPFSPSMPNSTDPTGILTTTPNDTSPADVPTMHPSPTGPRNCFVQPDGFYGSTGESQIVVRFTYELETKAGTAAHDVLPSLEKAFSDAILPELFAEQCLSPYGNIVQQNPLDVTGVSTKPDDIVLPSLACVQANYGNSKCVVVHGELTLFVVGTSGDAQTQIVTILKDRTKTDVFLSAHDGIKRVTLVDDNSPVNAGTGVETAPSPAPTSNPKLEILYGVLAALAVLLLILAIVVWRRKHDEDADSLNEIVPSDGSNDDEVGGEGDLVVDSTDLEV